MNDTHNLNRLLDDLLMDDAFEEQKTAILMESRKALARKRRAHYRARWIPAAAAILLAAASLFFWTGTRPASLPGNVSTGTPIYYVATQTLSSEQLVTTPATVPARYRIEKNTTVARVETRPLELDLFLNDQDLLALFADVPCGLVGDGTGSKTLFFCDLDDDARFYADWEG